MLVKNHCVAIDDNDDDGDYKDRTCNKRSEHAVCVMSCAWRSRPRICAFALASQHLAPLKTHLCPNYQHRVIENIENCWKMKTVLCLYLLLLPDKLQELVLSTDQLLIVCKIYMIYTCVHILSCFCIINCWQYSLIAIRAISRTPTQLESSCCGLWWRHLWRRASRCVRVRAND